MSADQGAIATPPPKRLLAQIDDRRTAGRLAATLPGQPLPDVHLTTPEATHVSLRHHVSGLVVLYFTPGEMDDVSVEGSLTRDAAQHRGYVENGASFAQLGARVFCITSLPQEKLRRIVGDIGVRHLTLSDPEMALANALGLPTLSDDGVPRYRRVVLVCNDGQIERTFGPLPDSEAAGSAHQVLTWLQATR